MKNGIPKWKSQKPKTKSSIYPGSLVANDEVKKLEFSARGEGTEKLGHKEMTLNWNFTRRDYAFIEAALAPMESASDSRDLLSFTGLPFTSVLA